MSKFRIYATSVLVPLLLGAAVGILTSPGEAFAQLTKPPLAPPSWLFPVVWSILYILMGVSYGLLKEKKLTDDTSNILYYAQLFVNLLWPVWFFLVKIRLFAFFWLALLTVLVILMIRNFYQKRRVSGLLQIPYLIWVLFAGYLNLSIYLLNR